MSWLPSPEYADWWYNLSWKGIIAFGAIAASATAAAVIFTVIQFWSDGVRDERASAQSAAMELQLGEAHARAAEANRVAESERLERLKLEERLAPRRITQADQKSIAAQISKFKDVKGGIGSSPNDIESQRLEMGIHGAVAMAGWELTRAIPTHTPMWPGGVAVASTFDKESQLAGVTLALALNSVGIFATFSPMLHDAATPQVFVTVGAKPDADDPLLPINRDALARQALELQKM